MFWCHLIIWFCEIPGFWFSWQVIFDHLDQMLPLYVWLKITLLNFHITTDLDNQKPSISKVTSIWFNNFCYFDYNFSYPKCTFVTKNWSTKKFVYSNFFLFYTTYYHLMITLVSMKVWNLMIKKWCFLMQNGKSQF